MMKKFIAVFGGISAICVCTACGNSSQNINDMNKVEETTIETEIKTESVTQPETETQSANSAFYSVEYDHFFNEGPVEYQDYFNPDLKFSINLSNGKVSHKMDETEIYFCQSKYFRDRYDALKSWVESCGRTEEDIYCLYTDVELTNLTGEDIIYTIANWIVYQMVETDQGTACEFLTLSPSYNYVDSQDNSMKYYEMEMKAGETKEFRIAFVVDKEEYFRETGMYFDEEHTDNIYLGFTGDEPLVSVGINGEYAPNDSEDLKLLKIPVKR